MLPNPADYLDSDTIEGFKLLSIIGLGVSIAMLIRTIVASLTHTDDGYGDQ